jgi:hypothetical protein
VKIIILCLINSMHDGDLIEMHDVVSVGAALRTLHPPRPLRHPLGHTSEAAAEFSATLKW